jgi:hypothetical protein
MAVISNNVRIDDDGKSMNAAVTGVAINHQIFSKSHSSLVLTS